MNYKILGEVWYTPPAPGFDAATHALLFKGQGLAVGVVAIESGPDGWKAYLGWVFVNTNHELSAEESAAKRLRDVQNIAAYGAKVTKAVACAHFPDLNPAQFKF